MAAGYDGQIRINTKVDTAGAKAGLSTLSSSLKSFAAMVGIAFSVQKIIEWTKSAKEAYKEQVTNETKLATIMRQRTNASDEQVQSIIELTEAQKKLGIIDDDVQLAGAQQLATFTTTTAQLKQLIPVLNDLTAQRYGYDATAEASTGIANMMGRALEGQTGALTRVGISMSDAEKKTITYGNKTQRAAVLAQVITENVGHMNAALANTEFGREKQLSNTMEDLNKSFGKAFEKISVLFIPMLSKLATWLGTVAEAANKVAQSLSNLFGGEATSASGAAAAVGDLTDATDANAAATATAAGSVANFDTANILSAPATAAATDTGASTDTTKAAAGMIAGVDTSIDSMTTKTKAFFDTYSAKIDEIKAKWAEIGTMFGEMLSRISAQFAGLNVGSTAFEAILNFLYSIESAANLVIGVIGNLFVALNVPAIIQSALGFLSSAFKAIGDAVTAVTPGIMAFVNEALVPIATWIGGKIADAFNFLGEQFTKVGNWFTSHTADFTELGTVMGNVAAAIWSVIEPLLNAVWETFKQAISGIIDVLLSLGDWILNHKQLVEDFLTVFMLFKTAEFVIQIGVAIAKLAILTAQMIINNIQWGILRIQLLANTVAMIANNVQWVLLAIRLGVTTVAQWLATAAVAAWDVICGIATLATTAFSVALAFLAANPIVLIIAAIVAIIAIIVLLVLNWDKVKAAAIACWDGIKSALGSAASWISTNVVTPVVGALNSFIESLKAIPAKVGEVVSSIGAFFNELPGKIGYGLGYAIGSLIKWGEDAASWAATNVPLLINNIATFFSELPAKIGNALNSVIDSFGAWISSIGSWISTNVPLVIDNIATFFSELPGKIGTFLSDALNDIGTWISNMADAVASGIPRIIDSIIGFFAGLPEKMLEIGENIVTGIWNGIEGMISWLGDKISDFVNGIVAGFKDGLGISSPSKVMKSMAKWIPAGIADGIIGNSGVVTDAMNSLTSGISGINISATSSISGASTPHLAQGAVIPPNRQFIATLGDQRRGVNIEAPLDTIKQGVSEVLSGMDLGGSDTSISFTGTLAALGRVLEPVITRTKRNQGASLVGVVT